MPKSLKSRYIPFLPNKYGEYGVGTQSPTLPQNAVSMGARRSQTLALHKLNRQS